MASSVVISNSSDAGQHVRMLQKRQREGAIVIKSLDGNGMVREECTTGLPQVSEYDVRRATMVGTQAEANQVALVLDKAAQDKYSWGGG